MGQGIVMYEYAKFYYSCNKIIWHLSTFSYTAAFIWLPAFLEQTAFFFKIYFLVILILPIQSCLFFGIILNTMSPFTWYRPADVKQLSSIAGRFLPDYMGSWMWICATTDSHLRTLGHVTLTAILDWQLLRVKTRLPSTIKKKKDARNNHLLFFGLNFPPKMH